MKSKISYLLLTAPVLANATSPTPNTVLNGTYELDGNYETIDASSNNPPAGYFLESGSLTINNATLQNFTTTGGSGSGGGAGLGGLIFINNGASVTLNNVQLNANTAVGGTGGTGGTGGVLNNLLSSSSNGSNGVAGDDAPEGAGSENAGNGRNGYGGAYAGDASGGFGGTGGNGGQGGPGTPTTADVVKTAAELTAAAIKLVVNGTATTALSTTLPGLEVAIAACAASGADPLATPVAEAAAAALEIVAVALSELDALTAGISVYDAAVDAAEAAYLIAVQTTSYLSDGVAGIGGNGGNGGKGGNGSFGFGGGPGGNGGTGGDAVGDSIAAGGMGGNGGNGGNGGFGGGGGLSGSSGSGGANGAPDTGVTVNNGSQYGNPGNPGLGGFGGGVGSTGNGTSNGTQGVGGSGFGGAVFVCTGGTLNINGPASFSANNVIGGASLNNGTAGSTAGSDLFMMHGSTVNLNPGNTNTITFNGTIADDSVTSIGNTWYTSGQGAGLNIQSGQVILNGSNTYTGQTYVTGNAVVQAVDGQGINSNSNINLGGGVLASSGSFSRFLGTAINRVQFTGSGVFSGFAAQGSPLQVQLNGGAPLSWTTTNFIGNGNSLLFGSTYATDDVTFTNSLDLGGETRTILATANQGNTNQAIISGVISNGALNINDGSHNGIVVLSNDNTYTGNTHVQGGTFILQGSLASPSITVDDNAAFDLANAGLISSVALDINGTMNLNVNEAINTLTGSGGVNLNSGTLTVNNGSFSGSIAGTDADYGLTKTSSGTLTLSGSNTFIGPVNLNAGTITLSGSLASQTVTVAAETLLNDNNGGLSSNTALNNSGTVYVGANDTISSLVNNGTINGSHTLTASTYSLNDGSVINANLGVGTLTDNGSVNLNGTVDASPINIQTGTTTLGSSQRLINTPDVTLDGLLVLGGSESIASLHGSGTLSITSGPISINQGCFSGYIEGTNSSFGVTKATSGTLTLSGANTYVGPTNVTAGTLSLTGSLADTSVSVQDGATLNDVNGGLNTATNLDDIGTFALGANQTINCLTGSGSVNLNQYTLTLNCGSFSGDISGDDSSQLIKNSDNLLTLSGANAFTGPLQLNAGTIDLTGSLASTSVNVSSGALLNDTNGGLAATSTLTNAGTVYLGADNQIGSFVNSGTLNGASATLVAVTYALNNDSTINANLGSGTLTDNGTVNINGTVGAATINIQTGTTTLGSGGRLTNTPVVTVDGSLILGGNEAIDTLNGSGTVSLNSGGLTVNQGSFSGSLTGDNSSYGLTKTSANLLTLSGSNTYIGPTNIEAGTLTLQGSLSSTPINISAGAVLNDVNGGLSSQAVVNNAGTFALSSNQTIGSLVNSGTLNGSSSTLTAATYLLQDGSSVNANLGTGTLTTNGTVNLSGTSAASIVNICLDSTLNLLGSQLLSNNATVNLTGVLSLQNGNQTVSTLNGTGTVLGNNFTFMVSNGGTFSGQFNTTNTNLVTQGGTLTLNNTPVNTQNIVVQSGSTLCCNGQGNVTSRELGEKISTAPLGTSIISKGNVIVQGGGRLDLTNQANLFTDGNVLIDPHGLVTIDDTSTLHAVKIEVGSHANLSIGNSDTLDYDTLQGSGIIESESPRFTNVSTVKGFLTFDCHFLNKGVLKPGNSPGVITITGNYHENGKLIIPLRTTTAVNGYSQVRVGGEAHLLSNAKLSVKFLNSYLPSRGDIYQIIANQYGGPIHIKGSFSLLQFDTRDNDAFVFDKATGQLIATGLEEPNSQYQDLGTNKNQRKAADSIFQVAQVDSKQINTNQLAGTLAAQILTTPLDPKDSLALYIPTFYGAMTDYAIVGDRALINKVWNRVSEFNALPEDSCSRGGLFAGFIDNRVYHDNGANLTRQDAFAGGNFYACPGFSLGVVGSKFYGHIHHHLGKSSADGEAGLLYASKTLGSYFTCYASGCYSYDQQKIHRQTMNGEAHGKTHTHTWSGNFGLQYNELCLGPLSVAPRANVVYSHSRLEGFKEKGPVDALQYKGSYATLFTGELGFSALLSTQLFCRALDIELTAGVEQTFFRHKTDLDAEVILVPEIFYAIEFAKNTNTRAVYGVNIGYALWRMATLYLGYEGFSGKTWSQSLNAGLRVDF